MTLKELVKSFGNYLRDLVNLSGDIDVLPAMTTIRNNVTFRGPNVFILFFAILIASLGLNVNSIPVIIGAMLVSPLMGPIMGFGLGLGTNDTNLVWKSLNNLLVMVVISVMASTLYFVLTPLNLEHPTELLARTNPTIYDVLIALFGGLAGIVEVSRKEKGTVISGVAIATALMPPLCTAGYGIAQLNWHYALGAMYLFCINSIFIALATFVMVKYFKYPTVQIEDKRKQRARQWIIYVILLIIIIPGLLSTISIVKDNNIQRSASELISENKTLGNSYIYDYKVNTDVSPAEIDIYVAGGRLSDDNRDRLYDHAERLGINQSQLVFHEEAARENIDQDKLIRDIFDNHARQIDKREMLIDSLKKELEKKESLIDSLKNLGKTADAGVAEEEIVDKVIK